SHVTDRVAADDGPHTLRDGEVLEVAGDAEPRWHAIEPQVVAHRNREPAPLVKPPELEAVELLAREGHANHVRRDAFGAVHARTRCGPRSSRTGIASRHHCSNPRNAKPSSSSPVRVTRTMFGVMRSVRSTLARASPESECVTVMFVMVAGPPGVMWWGGR